MKASGRCKQTNQGFTLIELLVVVAIIAILAALLFPALSKAKARALTVECISNHHQLQLAHEMYTTDNNEVFPISGLNSGPYGFYPSWVHGTMSYEDRPGISRNLTDNTNTLSMLQPINGSLGGYTRAARVYRCPADRSYCVISGEKKSRVRSYGLNTWISSSFDSIQQFYLTYHKRSALPTTMLSSLLSFAEPHEDILSINQFVSDPTVTRSQNYWLNNAPASRHNGRAVFSFLDGHGEIHKWKAEVTKQPMAHRTRSASEFGSNNEDIWWVSSHANFRAR